MKWIEFLQKDKKIVDKPWGQYYDHIRTENIVVKTLRILPGQAISYQRHLMRAEFWYIISGSGILKISPDELNPKDNYFSERVIEGQSRTIEEGVSHQITNDGKEDLLIFEVQYGHPNERDIERLDDPYKRNE